MALAYQDDGRVPSIADVPVRLTKDELLKAQSTDDFCQTVLPRQSRNPDTHFLEGNDGLLRRQHPTDSKIVQILLPETLRPRVLDLAHHTILAGHPGHTQMHRHIREMYYWPQMAAYIYKTFRNCTTCAKNRVKLRQRTNPLRLFPLTRPLESQSIDLLGPLLKTEKSHRFLLVMSDHFSNLTHVLPFRRIDAYTVAVAFVEAWVFKYGPPRPLISDNGRSSPRNSSKQSARLSESRTSSPPRITHRRTVKSNVTTARSSQCNANTSANTRTTGTDIRRHSRTRTTFTYIARPTRRRSTLFYRFLHPNSRYIILLNYAHLRQPNKRKISPKD